MINRIPKNIVAQHIATIILPSYSLSNSITNKPPAKYTDARTELKNNVWRDLDPSGKVKTIS